MSTEDIPSEYTSTQDIPGYASTQQLDFANRPFDLDPQNSSSNTTINKAMGDYVNNLMSSSPQSEKKCWFHFSISTLNTIKNILYTHITLICVYNNIQL